MHRLKVSSTVAACLMLAATVLGAPPASGATQLLPDMGMAPVSSVALDTTTLPGHRLLRYESRIVNVGAGAFEVNGTRAVTSSPFAFSQRIYDDAGGSTSIPITGTNFIWGGDGHHHWHVDQIESGTLRRLDNGVVVGTLAKHGFLMQDGFKYRTTLPGFPLRPVYNAAHFPDMRNKQALSVTEGVSVGWGETYGLNTNLQWIDITGLPNGRYRLTLSANDAGWFTESDTANNTATAVVKITATAVTVVSQSGGV